MLQYYLYFVFIVFFCITLDKETKIQLLQSRTKSVTYIKLVIGAMWFIIGLRGVNYGVDTRGYVNHFLYVTNLDLKESKEPLYDILTYIIRCVTDNYHVLFFICSAGYCIALYTLMRRYFSSAYQVLAAICILFLLGIFAFSMAGIRQTIAMGFTIFAFIEADRGNWKKFLLWIAIAFGFHNSSLIMLCIYPLRYINMGKYGFLLAAAFFSISFIMPQSVIDVLQGQEMVSERFGSYGTIYESHQNYSGFILQVILLLVAFLRKKHLKMNEKTRNLFFNMAFLGVATQSMTMIIAEFFRVSLYFCVFDIVLVPLALMTFTGKNNYIYRFIFIAGCLLYIFVLSSGVLPIPVTDHYPM